ncbi:DUF4135 domain-containing protein [Bacillus licheniformis]|nr:DUF4135 domain-containing protein [Bacillus licheniformis]
MNKSYHPDFLRDAVDREVFLCRVEKFEDADTDIAAAKTELKELIRGDIPYFLSKPSDCLEHDRFEIGEAKNLPTLDHQHVPVADYLHCIIEGFSAVYRLISDHGESYLATIEHFKNCTVRNILAGSTAVDKANYILSRSVRSTGILPFNLYFGRKNRDKVVDISGMGGQEAQESPFQALQIKGFFRDDIAEFIPHETCHTKKELEGYYTRLGKLLAVLYSIDAVDFHHENIIASGEHPVLIDLESIFHQYKKRDEIGVGDSHNKGKMAAILTYSDGKKIVYKPRSHDVDDAFQLLLSWINDRNSGSPLKTLRLINKKRYGWDFNDNFLVNPGYLRTLFNEYPVLLRLLCTKTDYWVQNFSELWKRLRQDREQLQAAFHIAGDPVHIELTRFASAAQDALEEQNIILSPPLCRQVLTHLKQTLLQIAHQTLILELNILRLEDQLKGDTPEMRYLEWLNKAVSLLSHDPLSSIAQSSVSQSVGLKDSRRGPWQKMQKRIFETPFSYKDSALQDSELLFDSL